jgi:uncharacterized protein YcfL
MKSIATDGGNVEDSTTYRVYWYDQVCGFWAGSSVDPMKSLSEARAKVDELKTQGYRVQLVTTITEEF